MSSWSVAIDFVLRHEGGYANDPADLGGETYRGISRRFHPGWSGWSFIDARKPIEIGTIFLELDQQVRDWFYNEFWVAVRGPEIPGSLAICLFDFAVLSGPEDAITFLQREVGIDPPTGFFRERTMEGVRKEEGTYVDLARRITMHRAAHYANRCKRDPSQLKFLGGWTSRLVDLAVTFSTLKVA